MKSIAPAAFGPDDEIRRGCQQVRCAQRSRLRQQLRLDVAERQDRRPTILGEGEGADCDVGSEGNAREGQHLDGVLGGVRDRLDGRGNDSDQRAKKLCGIGRDQMGGHCQTHETDDPVGDHQRHAQESGTGFGATRTSSLRAITSEMTRPRSGGSEPRTVDALVSRLGTPRSFHTSSPMNPTSQPELRSTDVSRRSHRTATSRRGR